MTTAQEIECRSQSLSMPTARWIRSQIGVPVCDWSLSLFKVQALFTFPRSTAKDDPPLFLQSVWTTGKFSITVFSLHHSFLFLKSGFLKQFGVFFVCVLSSTVFPDYLLVYRILSIPYWTPTISNPMPFLALIYSTLISSFPFSFNFLI